MITPFDDFPIHQTGDPIVQTVSADPNHYDRYFFNGFDRDGAFFLGGAMGRSTRHARLGNDARCACHCRRG